jgi:hypothetical protein
MLAALHCLDELLADAVARWHAVQGADPFRGLHIGPEDVERWLAATGAEPDPISAGLTSVMTRAVTAALDDPVFHWLTAEFSLTAFHAAALIITFAPELDLRYERLFAYLQDDVGKRRPTVDLILRLLCPDRTNRAMWLGEFGPGAPLVRNRLIAVSRNAEAPLLSAPVQLDDQIAAVLLRHDQLDNRLTGFCRVSAANKDLGVLPIAPEWHRALPPLLASARAEHRPLRFYLQGPSGVGKGQLAEAIATRLGARLVTADLAALRQLSDMGERLRLTFREVWLKGGILYLTGVDGLREDWAHFSTLLRLVAADSGVTVLSGHGPWNAAELDATGILPLAFDVTAPGVQRASWARPSTMPALPSPTTSCHCSLNAFASHQLRPARPPWRRSTAPAGAQPHRVAATPGRPSTISLSPRACRAGRNWQRLPGASSQSAAGRTSSCHRNRSTSCTKSAPASPATAAFCVTGASRGGSVLAKG